VAFTSHLPQVTATALACVVGRCAGTASVQLAGPGLVDTTRLADSPFAIWEDICRTNSENIRDALDRLGEMLGALREHLSDPAALERAFEEARGWREALRGAAGTGTSNRDRLSAGAR
jgi:prephenate dehydrogenase